jgi:diketogulonate reductase-like aldo/keto reductase
MLGKAWRASGLKRSEFFLTTKIHTKNFGPRHLQESFRESLAKLQTEYVDLLLLHFPVPILRKKAWQTLEAIQASGKVRDIGVSNYSIRQLKEMKAYAKTTPAVNQVELHVFFQQPELIKYCKDHNILVEAYSPLAHAKAKDNKVVTGIAKKHGKSYAQIMLRWLIGQDLVVLPKSVTPSRIQENIEIFDFSLDAEDIEALRACDRNMRTIFNLPLLAVVGLEIAETLAFRRR